jgi:hypothetical protein
MPKVEKAGFSQIFAILHVATSLKGSIIQVYSSDCQLYKWPSCARVIYSHVETIKYFVKDLFIYLKL